MQYRALGELYRWMADLLESEGAPAERAQAYRDTAHWILGADEAKESPARSGRGAVLPEAGAPVAVFDGLEVDDPQLMGV
jgi:hypothetical protein